METREVKTKGFTLLGRKIDFLGFYIVVGLVFLALRGMPWGSGSSSVLAFMLFFAGVFGTIWFKRKSLDLGPKVIYIPLLILVASSLLWLFLDDDIWIALFYFFTMLFMFGMYITAIQKGHSLAYFAIPIVLLLSIATIWDGLSELGTRATGFSANTDQIASMLVVMVFLLRGNWRWLTPLPILAILFTGSYWAALALVACLVVSLVTRDIKFSRWGILTSTALVIIIVLSLLFSTGLHKVWQFTKVSDVVQTHSWTAADSLDTRASQFEGVISNFSIIGHGLALERDEEDGLHSQDGRYGRNVHNVPLILLDDMGLGASLAWIFVTLIAIWYSKRYRYAFVAIFIMSITGSGDWWWFNLWMPFYFVMLGLVALEIKEKELTPRWMRYRGSYGKRI